MAQRSSDPVRSITKACALLDILTEAGRPLTLGELAAASGHAKSTVYGLLSSMRSTGLVDQDPDSGRYSLGMRLYEYGSAVQRTRSILTLCKAPMQRLVEATGESASLSMLDRGEALVLAHAEPDSAFHIVSETGAHLPAFCTAQGKILLSALPRASVKRIFEAQATAFTPHTVRDFDALDAELNTVREKGCAIENGEFRVGIRGVAAPVKTQRGEVKYALGLIGMFRRVDSDEFRAATALVTETAKTLSEALGWRE